MLKKMIHKYTTGSQIVNTSKELFGIVMNPARGNKVMMTFMI